MRTRTITIATAVMMTGALGTACSSTKEEVASTAQHIDDSEPKTDLFCPKAPVSRRDMAYFLERMKHGRYFDPPPASGHFSDVRSGSVDERWIEQLWNDGITKGCGEHEYCPTENVPREQMAAFIIRLTHGPDFQRPGGTRYVDVTGGSEQFAGYIEQLADDGITKGCDADHFCPRDTVTREQMAAFLMRAIHPGTPDLPPTGRFGDVTALTSGNLGGRVEQAVAEGIMEPCATAQVGVGALETEEANRTCKFLCDAAAGAACAYATENPYVVPACVAFADNFLCPDLCTAGNWRQMCFVTNPEYGCTVCCQSVYGCGPEECARPPAW